MIVSVSRWSVQCLRCGPPVDVNIVFRADASQQIGSGHVMRCLALAGELRNRGADVHFICRDHPSHLAGVIREQGYACTLLARPDGDYIPQPDDPYHAEWLGVPWRQDLEDTLNAIDGRADWLVVDHYAVEHRWHRESRSQASRIMVIDDLADRRYDCDILLDQTLGRRDEQYRSLVPASARLLLGAEHALLRPEFFKLRRTALEARRQHAGIRRILVTMGGMDPANISSAVLRGLAAVDWPHKPEVDVVLGGGAPHRQEVEALADGCGLPVRVLSDVRNMSELMVQADLGIGAGGSTSWERCCLGLPSLLVELVENQRDTVAGLKRAGAVAAVPLESLEEEITTACSVLLRDPERLTRMSIIAAGVTDGLGAKLAAIRLCPRAGKDGGAVTLRRVKIEDAGLIYEWQSNPETRRYAHNPEVPAYEEHVRWLQGKLVDPDSHLYMIESDGIPAGVVRLDDQIGPNEGSDGYLVSIYTAPGYYRRGLGGIALEYMNELFAEYVLYADILPENVASQRLFAAAGFRRFGDRDRYVRSPEG